VKLEHRQPTCLEGYVSSFPQPLPIGELLAESEAPVLRKAKDIEYLVVQELRGARLPVIHLESVQSFLEGCCLGRFAGVCVASIHGPLRTHTSGVEECGYVPGGTYFGAWVVILRTEKSSRPTEKERRDRRMTDCINKAAEDHIPGGLFVCSRSVDSG
jgi:hypothetical protein